MGSRSLELHLDPGHFVKVMQHTVKSEAEAVNFSWAAGGLK